MAASNRTRPRTSQRPAEGTAFRAVRFACFTDHPSRFASCRAPRCRRGRSRCSNTRIAPARERLAVAVLHPFERSDWLGLRHVRRRVVAIFCVRQTEPAGAVLAELAPMREPATGEFDDRSGRRGARGKRGAGVAAGSTRGLMRQVQQILENVGPLVLRHRA